MRADLKIEEKEDDKKAREARESGLTGLLERMRAVLGDRVKEVRFSDRLTDSPCCLVLAGAGPHGYVERLLREAGRDVPKSERILELNPRHAILRNLETLVERADPQLSEWIRAPLRSGGARRGGAARGPGGVLAADDCAAQQGDGDGDDAIAAREHSGRW